MPPGSNACRSIVCGVIAFAHACGGGGAASGDASGVATSTSTSTLGSAGTTTGTGAVTHDGHEHGKLDTLVQTTGEPEPWCDHCYPIDILVVVDNSASMTQEQANVAARFSGLVDEIEMLYDYGILGQEPDVHIMVTTTDVGHPLCERGEDPGYTPRGGTPVFDGCNARIASFTGVGENAEVVEDACTSVCPVDVVPTGPYLHFAPGQSNVVGGTPEQALACIGPQGIDGCDYGSPLEAMLRALDPEACWNDPERAECVADPRWSSLDAPFLRDGATLMVAIITDDSDCSVDAPDGFTYFTDLENDEYWEVDPETGARSPSPAVCWNAGVTCDPPDGDGVYADCVAVDNPVLHPTDRYLEALRAYRDERDVDVYMIGILGVPLGTNYDTSPPYLPIDGGVDDVVLREWVESDLTPAEVDAGVTVAHKVWEHGNIAPGCANERASGIFSKRVHEVCQGLDLPDDPETPDLDEFTARCCVESLCDDGYNRVFRCLTVGVSLK